MLKLRGISRSSAILGSDSPQSNNRKDNSLCVTPFIPRERPNVKHAISGYCQRQHCYRHLFTSIDTRNKGRINTCERVQEVYDTINIQYRKKWDTHVEKWDTYGEKWDAMSQFSQYILYIPSSPHAYQIYNQFH